jgi:hypothetical protein
MEYFDIYYGDLVYIMAIGYILWPFSIFSLFGIFLLYWYIVPKNLATLQ